MNILVTGGAGYIGSHVVKQLLEQTEHVISILDNLSTGHMQTVQTLQEIGKAARGCDNDPIDFFHVDLSDFATVGEIVRTHGFDAVIHFAASIIVPESIENPLKYYMNNTVNTTNLISLCNRYGVKHFVFSSTAAVYGETDEKPVEETHATNPINPYGMSKLMSERVLFDASAANENFSCAVLRYFNVAGADVQNRIGQSFPNATNLIKVVAETAAGIRESVAIFGEDYPTKDGTGIRDYIHVDDLAAAHLCALDYLSGGGSSDVFNVGYGHGFSVKEVVATMKTVCGHDFSALTAPRRAGDPANVISANTKLKNTLEWTPQYDDLELICKTALDWEKVRISRSGEVY